MSRITARISSLLATIAALALAGSAWWKY